MTQIRIRIENLGAVERALTQYGAKAEAEISRVLDTVGTSIINGVKKQMRSPKSGRTYKRGKRGRDHVASAPGEAPAVDTGRLVADGSFYKKMISPTELIGGSNVIYSKYLEYGTRSTSTHPGIKPRPSWTLELYAHREILQKAIEGALRRAAQ
jgi:hypothetical protein